jgi:hypothetical protein
MALSTAGWNKKAREAFPRPRGSGRDGQGITEFNKKENTVDKNFTQTSFSF